MYKQFAVGSRVMVSEKYRGAFGRVMRGRVFVVLKGGTDSVLSGYTRLDLMDTSWLIDSKWLTLVSIIGDSKLKGVL